MEIYLILSIVLPAIIVMVNYVLAPKAIYSDKVSAYECGFDPYGRNSRQMFDIHYYLVSILFIIFDLEIALLFPWASDLSSASSLGMYVIFLFVLILVAGIFYEWNLGVIKWKNYSL